MSKDSQFRLVGLGVWHTDDTSILEAMLEPSNQLGCTPLRISQPKPPKMANVSLVPLSPKEGNVVPGTTHMIREYQHSAARVDVVHRTDWEDYGDRHQVVDWILTQDQLSQPCLKRIQTVIIKDLCKGVVTRPLIQQLAQAFPSATWFVSTKDYRPVWFQDLPRTKVKLLMVPQIAAKKAREPWNSPDKNPVTWLCANGRATREGLEALKELHSEYARASGAIVVSLPGGDQMLAVGSDNGQHANQCWRQTERDLVPVAVDVPMASVLLGSLVGERLAKKNGAQWGPMLEDALAYTSRWRRFEAGRVDQPDLWLQHHEPIALVQNSTPIVKVDQEDLKPLIDDWLVACDLNRLGILRIDDRPVLQTWRATVPLPKYVCLAKDKRLALSKLLDAFGQSRLQPERRQVGCLLVAPPGSGKTFLVEQIAVALGLDEPLVFNIAEMLTQSALLDCFDRLVAFQTNDRKAEKPSLVFFDELNAKIQGEHVYRMFLSILEEGTYVRDGERFRVEPCLWLFAETNATDVAADKRDDFVNRLVIPEIRLHRVDDAANDSATRETRLEQVYVGAKCLRQSFSGVRRASHLVLEMFSQLKTSGGFRQVVHCARAFSFIQGDTAYAFNAPIEWLRTRMEGYDNWHSNAMNERETRGRNADIVSLETA